GALSDVDHAVDRAAAVLGPRARRLVPVGPLTSYRVGGPAALFFEVSGEADLDDVARAVRESGVEVLVVGRGSNLLVADAGFPGLAVVLGAGFTTIAFDATDVVAGAAVSLPVLARRTAVVGLTGLEWSVGVPGSVGGAVRMNAGGHGSDVSRNLVSAEVYDLSGGGAQADGRSALHGTVGADRLDLGYRRSALDRSQVVVSARFALAPGDRSTSEATIADIVRWRREHQPGGSNGGSVFANPAGDSAGRLIDEAGLKGHRRGSAFVSPKHANFVQVDAGGSADDVADLVAEVRRLVEVRTGVRLEVENHLVGFDEEAR
ncbi:MAG: UDP-N-acetylmuramate dehydrogenase, partial [Actinomycetota bacterium]|nr:UDP-N-acetylmuramate dehydrogenase [Actinomycetota bacterium]